MKAIILSSPGNTSGEVFDADLIHSIVSWARSKEIHMIFEEIYAPSVFAKNPKFVSVAEVLRNELGDDVRIIWSSSSDFCASGLRVGVLYGQKEDITRAFRPLIWFRGLSSLTGWG